METTLSAVQSSATSSQQSLQPDLVNILTTDVSNRQLMAVCYILYCISKICYIYPVSQKN